MKQHACAIEVLFTPIEFAALRQRNLSGSLCVVFDVLRATSVIVTALANGAESIIPVEEIEEALEFRRQRPDVLLAGERNGLRIGSELTGGVEFDFGNSPREYTPERVSGRTIVTTTTNGTRSLRACSGARMIIAAAFLNLSATQEFIIRDKPAHLVIVCAGTGNDAALEDVLAAGALCDSLVPLLPACDVEDSAEIARRAYRQSTADVPAAVRLSRNAHRLRAIAALRDDVEFSLLRDTHDLVPVLGRDGVIRKFV